MTRDAHPLSREEAEQAIARCSRDEGRILRELTPHEVSLILEAKLFADATITDENTGRRVRG